MLYGNFTARQNLDFFAKLGGRTDLTRSDYYQVMRRVSLQEKAFDQRVKNFSKGMRQKLASPSPSSRTPRPSARRADLGPRPQGRDRVPGDHGRAQDRG